MQHNYAWLTMIYIENQALMLSTVHCTDLFQAVLLFVEIHVACPFD